MKRVVFLLAIALIGAAVYSESPAKATHPSTVRGTVKKIKSANIGILRYVPAGTFQRDDDPANVSTVAGFYMSEKEITWEQFATVTKLSKPSFSSAAKYVKKMSAPVTTITWYHCIYFCNKLSLLEGLTPVYSISGSTDPSSWGKIPENVTASWDAVTEDLLADGYRLPTEMEWEWAAMGAVDGISGYEKAFAGSDNLNNVSSYVWFATNSDKLLHPVGMKKPNELGLYDMNGNAQEWCWDWQDEYPSGALDSRTFRGAENGGKYGQRGIRGGSFESATSDITVGSRGGLYPNNCDVQNGFRVVRYEKH